MKKVVLSKRAYLSMLAEVYERVETETGGILLGHRDGETWYVLESVDKKYARIKALKIVIEQIKKALE